MADKHAIVRTDLLHGTDSGVGLVSFRFVNSEGNPAAIDNGNVVKLGKREDGQREVFVATAPAADTKLTEIALVANDEVMYDERKTNLTEYYNEAGEITRGYRILHSGEIFSVTAEALTGTKAKDDFVELQAGTKLNTAGTATGGSTVVGKLVEIEEVGADTYYCIQVD